MVHAASGGLAPRQLCFRAQIHELRHQENALSRPSSLGRLLLHSAGRAPGGVFSGSSSTPIGGFVQQVKLR